MIHPKLGDIQWEAWPHLVYLLDIIQNNRQVVILKAKQLGITWLIGGGYALWMAMFHEGANILILSKGEVEASEELGYARFIHSRLPSFLKLPKGRDQQSLIEFPSMNSKIRALPSTRDTGVGFGGATLVICDEWEYHDYAKENYAEVKPMIDAGGQLIILSTADKLRHGTKFKEVYNKARAGENKFFKVFLPYNLLPYRTEEWYKDLSKDYAQWEIECKYPRNEEEALATISVLRFFDEQALNSMEMDILSPINSQIDTHDGIVKVYKPPVVGERYCVFTDPSDGKEDPFHTVVINSSGEGVCEAHAKVTADYCAKIHDEIVRAYNNASNSFEINASAGGKFQETIKALNTPNVQPTRKTDGTIKPESYGWYTTPQHKRIMLWDCEEAVRKRQIRSHDKDTIMEMRGFIVPEGGEPQATVGLHDDKVMAWAGVWQVYKHMPKGDAVMVSGKYKISW